MREDQRYRWVILFAAFVAGMAGPLSLFSMPPLFPILSRDLATNLTGINAAAMTSFGLGMVLMAIPFSIIYPRFGWKNAGLINMAAIAAGAFITVLSTSVLSLAIGRFVAGLGMGMAFSWPTGAMSAWFSRDEMGRAMGIWSATLPLSGLFIFVASPVMIDLLGWRSVLWFTLFWVIGALILWYVVGKPPAGSQSGAGKASQVSDQQACRSSECVRSAFLNRDMWLVGIAWFAVNYYLLGLTSLSPTYFTEIAGFPLFTASALAILPVSMIIWVSPVTGMLSDRFHTRKKFIIVSMSLSIISGCVLLFLGTSLVTWTVFFVMLGCVWGFAPSVIFASPREIVGPLFAGPASGILIFMVGVASLLAPVITGTLVPLIGWQGALASTAIPSIGGLVAVLLVRTLP